MTLKKKNFILGKPHKRLECSRTSEHVAESKTFVAEMCSSCTDHLTSLMATKKILQQRGLPTLGTRRAM